MNGVRGNLKYLAATLASVTTSSSIGYTACMDGSAIPEEKRGHPDSRWQKRLRQPGLRELGLFAFIVACTRSFLLAGRATFLASRLEMDRQSSRAGLASSRAIRSVSVNRGSCLHLHSKLWRIALPVSFLMFLFTMYLMGS